MLEETPEHNVPDEVRKLAYECALKFNIEKIPPSWHKHKKAGKDWFTNFLKRNPSLSIRTPEATSAGRATSFNRHNVTIFFEKLGALLDKYHFTASRIWNLDETGVTTVLKPKKIVAAKGTKQVGAIVSAERGTLVTVELAANALGNTIPPMFVFPRLKFKDLFIRDGPPECIGAGNASGWMTSQEFFMFMDHFIKHTKPTPSEPVLLLLDNHSSHIDINVVDKAKENSVIMLSFPPHCTHRLQPLDVGVNGPFKSYCAKAQDIWLRNNAGKTMSIYEIPGIVKYAWPLAATPSNISNAFRKAGIWPFNPTIFTDDDFAPSYVTDRPDPGEENAPEHHLQTPCSSVQPEPSTSEVNNPVLGMIDGPNLVDLQPEASTSGLYFSPEIIRPLPKAPPRKSKVINRRIRKSAVLTDTPEKNMLEEEQAKKQRNVNVKGKGKKSKGQTKDSKKDSTKRRVLQDSESDEEDDEKEEYYCLICCDSYSNSLPREKWIQCLECKMWAHMKCIEKTNSITYICPNCNSDDSFDDSM